ncbi:ribosome recycling factor [Candidatus Uhrbacteria bacterium]|nr:ribosome recycling factor [Candidatus Uhrbacteria bacterium]
MLDHLHKELSALRTGRASPALVENIAVEAYGSMMDVKSVASISTTDAKTLIITPWDKTVIQAIEKAIRDADIGVSPAVDGSVIRISVPQMTEETRKKLSKIVNEKAEEAKIGVRQVREKAREEIVKQEKEKAIGEDDKFKMLDEMDILTKEYTGKVEEMVDRKTEEIMTV